MMHARRDRSGDLLCVLCACAFLATKLVDWAHPCQLRRVMSQLLGEEVTTETVGEASGEALRREG